MRVTLLPYCDRCGGYHAPRKCRLTRSTRTWLILMAAWLAVPILVAVFK